jgi:penicillin-binding protein 1C
MKRALWLTCLALGLWSGSSLATPWSFAAVKSEHQSSLRQVLDRHGQRVAQLRENAQVLQWDWLGLDEFSPALVEMVLRSEDQSFAQHVGVDFQAMVAALRQTARGQRRGASTITMQLVGLMESERLRKVNGQRSVPQKLTQIAAAIWLEQRWSKAEILEAYLNKVPLVGELQGMPAGARALFGKAAHGLSLDESAILAALLRAPNAAPAVVAQRSCALLRSSACDLLEGQVRIALSQATRADWGLVNSARHYARYVLKQSPATPGTGPLLTSLDARLQNVARQSMQRHLRELASRQVEDGAAVVLDRLSGEVLAWLGSSGELSDAAQVDFVLAKRQAGSTLKPFLYAQAIAERRITAASLIDDQPINLSTAAGLYVPKNYEQHYLGPVPARLALGSSLNIPAVRVAVMLTPDQVFQTLRGFGFKLRESGGYFGHSIALGSAEVSLLELVRAYRELSLLERRSAGVDGGSKFIVGDILADDNARSATFGLSSPLSTRGWAAVKTGTSKDMRDNWCIGFTDRFVIGVWVGNASGEPMHGVSGVSGAAPIWADLVNDLHRSVPSVAPSAPSGMVSTKVNFDTQALRLTRAEWFLAGTELAHVSLDTASGAAAKILHPSSGTLLALDPDIPPTRQKLRLRASKGDSDSFWKVDGRALASSSPDAWSPRPGRHQISLHDGQGHLLEQVWVEVRGAQEKSFKSRPAMAPTSR